MASATIARLYREARKAGVSWRVGFDAADSLSAARTLAKWKALESIGAVQLAAELDECWLEDRDEESEAFGVIGQYRTDWMEREHWHYRDPEEWEHGDSVWGNIGYRDVADWHENEYVVGIMAETIISFRDAWKAEVQRRRDLAAGLCPACHGTGKA